MKTEYFSWKQCGDGNILLMHQNVLSNIFPMHQNILRQFVELYSSPLPRYRVGDLSYNIDKRTHFAVTIIY